MAANVSPTAAPQMVLTVPRHRIRPCKNQPRKYFNKEALQSLADSLLAEGQKTPAEVKPLIDDPHHDYELTDGERRWRALDLIDVRTMRIWVNPVADEKEQFINSVVANFGREGHTPMETARAISRILEHPRYAEGSMTDRLARVAKLFAKSGSWAAMHVSLLNLHPEVQEMVEPTTAEDQRLGFVIAHELSSLADKDLQLKIARRVSKEGLALKQARRLVRKMAKTAGVQIGKRSKPSDVRRTFERFLEQLSDGTEAVLELPKKPFQEMIQKTDPSVRKVLLTRINEGIERLSELKEVLERAAK